MMPLHGLSYRIGTPRFLITILTPRERGCLVLRYYDDLRVDDIAETLGLSSAAFTVH